MKIVFNKQITEDNKIAIHYSDNAFFSGDFINGYGWFFNNKLLFWEEVYFQLMASMRKMRMIIPISYTPEMLENKVLLLSEELKINKGRFKFTIFRNTESTFSIKFLPYKDFLTTSTCELDVYKEIPISPNLLSSIYVFQPVNLTALHYAKENSLNDLIILNNEKRMARAISGNIFYIKNNTIYTNPASEGALISVLKNKLIVFLQEKTDYNFKEEKISPFELQSAEEVFILSDEQGLIPVTKIRKKTFNSEITSILVKKFIGFAL